MRQATTFLVLMLLMAGCAASRRSAGTSPRQRLERTLAAAVQRLEVGATGEATNMLAAVCAEPGVPGVTDEALLRLALLRLRSETHDDAPDSARQALERLQSEYPASPWSRQAAPLLDLLVSDSELRRANRNLRSLNSSLSRENDELTRQGNELQERLDRLKSLDLELENKGR
jgi:hypothetical protein